MTTIANPHQDLIHDAVLDYHGKRLATCSSDKLVKIFALSQQQQQLQATLKGHEGPVWQLGWAHPKFGSILASCSYDGKVLIWKEEASQWSIVAQHSHAASVNSISWAPVEYGAQLLCSSSDGTCSIIEFISDGSTKVTSWDAHKVGVNAATWGPVMDNVKRVVTGGCDNLVKIWNFVDDKWSEEATLEAHTDWVRDVAWSSSLLNKSYIATASQDRTVLIWTKRKDGIWQKKLLDKFPDVCWRVSWSLSGNVLAVSGGDNKITLWKEDLSGEWSKSGEVEQ
ncbi:GTPase-activating protein [Martiniozyma asiatica (nom. inval.)]|nr:GTPase-activating protein [Martiniozyma asiatica]